MPMEYDLKWYGATYRTGSLCFLSVLLGATGKDWGNVGNQASKMPGPPCKAKSLDDGMEQNLFPGSGCYMREK